MKHATEYGIFFDQFLKPMDILDVTLFTDAVLNIVLEGYSDQGQWFKNNWNDIQLHYENDGDVVWKELVAAFAFLHSLRHSLNEKVVHVYTDNEACKCSLVNMRAKLSRPDLHLNINEMCKICMHHEINPQVEHIPGKQNILPDALSRNEPIPDNPAYNCAILTSATNSAQLAADVCRNMVINEKHLR